MPNEFTSHNRERRRFLKTTGTVVTAASIGLSGCTGNGDENGADDSNDTGNGEESYPADDIRWVVPYGAGGGFDVYARAFAEFMPAYLPNDINIIVDNVTGAGGQTGATETFRADPDGYTIGMWNIPGFAVAQLLGDVNYDVETVSMVGRISAQEYLLVVRDESDFETIEDVIDAEEVSLADTGPPATGFIVNLIGSEGLGINANIITGYEGTQDALTGVLRGDADARFANVGDLAQLVSDGELRPLVTTGTEAPSFAPDTPTVADLGHEELEVLRVQFLAGGPPEIDSDRLDILQSAFMDAIESDEMQQWSDDNDMGLTPADGDRAGEIAQDSLEVFGQYRDLLEEHM